MRHPTRRLHHVNSSCASEYIHNTRNVAAAAPTLARIQSHSGVTLIELLMGLVVVSVLAAIAIPAYRSYVIRSQRSDAQTSLQHVQAAEERFFLKKGRYTADLFAPQNANLGGLGLGTRSDHTLYSLSVELTASGYIARALRVPRRGQSDDTVCRSFSLDENGLERALDRTGGDESSHCWR
jgi:type IV pilus assembly protein PilE